MELKNKTILITGGGSGIGYETARLLGENNKVIIIGRNAEKLQKAAASLKNVDAFACDVTDDAAVKTLVHNLETNYPGLSVLVNNAGKAFKYDHGEKANAYEKAAQEINTNYLSVLRLTEYLLPLLKKQPEAAIVNVTSIVALSPASIIPTYSDSKAALHSYTLSLRKALSETNIMVFELQPPTVNTEFAREIGGKTRGIPAADVAKALIEGVENNVIEIGVGMTIPFAKNYFPQRLEAFSAMNSR